MRQLGQFDGRCRRELGRLQYEGVASGEPWGQLVHRKKQRRIPRGDGDTHTEGFVTREVEGVRLVDRQHGPFDLVRQTAEIAEILREI